jgi:hypothetical protein
VHSCIGCHLIKPAADKWDAARFLAVFNILAGFRFRALFTSHPIAANAKNWLAKVSLLETKIKTSPSLMSKWQDFDQRKICPQCGDYQTRVVSKQRQSFSSPRLLYSLMRYIGVALVLIIALLLLSLRPLNVYELGFLFVGF